MVTMSRQLSAAVSLSVTVTFPTQPEGVRFTRPVAVINTPNHVAQMSTVKGGQWKYSCGGETQVT
ncbi:hypothetical protein EYF80_032998 [Liparis tanakae]|uniref:Uncharacterized protein n=1 Tax=Liparis tanakae TaxID=230148 RepID=A0A4Z2GUC5_9TELE|nr:hypothetical protein EYF80_032998 [Liparis tanakae]